MMSFYCSVIKNYEQRWERRRVATPITEIWRKQRKFGALGLPNLERYMIKY